MWWILILGFGYDGCPAGRPGGRGSTGLATEDERRGSSPPGWGRCLGCAAVSLTVAMSLVDRVGHGCGVGRQWAVGSAILADAVAAKDTIT